MTKETATLSPAVNGVTNLVLEYDSASDGWFLYAHDSMENAPMGEFWHMSADDAKEQALADYSVSSGDWVGSDEENETPTRDSNGTILQNGDTVTLIKDLPVKGAGVTIKRGTTVKNISLTANPEEIDCRTKEVKGLVLKTCFVKKI